jgi:hypothetical protein
LAPQAGFAGPVRAVAFSPDGRRLAGWSEGRIHLGAASGDGPAILIDQGVAGPEAVAFSPDGSRLLAARAAGGAAVWDAGSGKETARLRLRPLGGGVPEEPAAAFSPDGRRAAVRVRPGRFVLWDIESRRCLGVLDGEGDVRSVAAGREPLRCKSVRGREVEVSGAAGEAVAWLPEPLDGLAAAPATRTWAGVRGDHLHVFSLVGQPGPLAGAGGDRSACALCDGDCQSPYLMIGQGAVVGAECLARAAEGGTRRAPRTTSRAGTCLHCGAPTDAALCAECLLLGLELVGADEPLDSWAVETLLAALGPGGSLRRRVLILRRFAAVLSLAEQRQPEAVGELRERLARQLGFEGPPIDRHVRQQALTAVQSLGRPMLDPLLRLGRGSEGRLRVNAVLAVGLIVSASPLGESRGTPPDDAPRRFLEEAARDPNPEVRGSVVRGLVRATPGWCRSRVRTLADDSHPEVAQTAGRVLKRDRPGIPKNPGPG